MVTVVGDAALARRYGVDGSPAAFLIRPDGYVAAVFADLEPTRVQAAVRAQLGAGALSPQPPQ